MTTAVVRVKLTILAAVLLPPFRAMVAQGGVAVDAAVGISIGNFDSGLTLDGAVAYRPSGPRTGWTAAVVGASEGFGPHGDRCRIMPSGRCLRDPTFKSVAILGGGQFSRRFVSLGIAAGPGYYRSSDETSAAGFQGRMELSTPVGMAGAFVLTGRRTWMPDFEGHDYTINAVTFGIRLR